MAEDPEIHPSTSSSTSSDQSASADSLKDQTKAAGFGGINLPDGNVPAFPIMYPAFVPGLFPPQMGQEHMNRGPGLYAVPVFPFTQPVTGIPYNNLIPFTYNIPTERSSQEVREGSGGQGQPGEQPQPPQEGAQRQVRRFQIAIQIDLLLMLKLAALIFLFNQDGSKQRLAFLVFLASLIYLYQTGALAPVIRWLSQGMHRAAAPPQPARGAGRQDDLPAAGALGNEDVGMAGEQPAAGENENQQMNDGNMGNENEIVREPGQGEAGNRWRAVLKEVQMIVFGFITSLLPGFHNID